MKESKTYYLFVKGKKVEVSEEVYRAYVRPEWKRHVQEYRGKDKVQITSLEALAEKGFEIEDNSQDIETAVIENEENTEKLLRLRAAISRLSERDRLILRLYFFEGKIHQEIADIFGISRQAVQRQSAKILERLKNFL